MLRKLQLSRSGFTALSLLILSLSIILAFAGPVHSIGHSLVSQKAYFVKKTSDKLVYTEKLEAPKGKKLMPFWLTFYNGYGARPGFDWVKVEISPVGKDGDTETIVDHNTFSKSHAKTVDLTGYFSEGPLNLNIEGSAKRGDYFAWRLTTGQQVLTLFKSSRITPGKKFAVQGFGFGEDPKVVAVYVQGMPAEIISIKNKILVARAPEEVSGDRVTVYVKVGEKTSNYLSIIADYKPPHIISISPEGGNIGDSITIKGVNFSEVGEENIVRFGPHKAQTVKSVDKQTLVCRVPDFGINNDTLPLTVTTNGIRSDNFIEFWCGTNIF